MNDMAKVLKGGTRQLVELPEGFEIEADEVAIVRVGNSLVMEAPDAIDEETGLPIATLRALIQQGIDSGPSESWDLEAMRREMHARRS